MRMLLRKLALVALFVILAIMVGRIVEGLSTTPGMPPSTPTATVSAKPTPIGGGTGRIAFATFHKNQIYTINADGTGLVHLTDVLTEPRSLHWSNDGAHLAFSTFEGSPEIYAMNADGFDLHRIAKVIGAGGFSWSPDNKSIVYVSQDGLTPLDNQIYAINIDGAGLIQLTQGSGNHEHPAWAPDGKRIAFQFKKDSFIGGYEVHLINVDGSGEISIADGFTYLQELLWSPDGKLILVSSGNPVQIYVVSADGSWRKQLTNTSGNNLQAGWSPDGKRIVYASSADGTSRIYVINADGSEQKMLTNNPDTADGFASWSPDGQWITYTSLRIKPEVNCCTSCCVNVYIMKADGSEQRKLTNEIESTWKAAWRP
jgi:TolB protein